MKSNVLYVGWWWCIDATSTCTAVGPREDTLIVDVTEVLAKGDVVLAGFDDVAHILSHWLIDTPSIIEIELVLDGIKLSPIVLVSIVHRFFLLSFLKLMLWLATVSITVTGAVVPLNSHPRLTKAFVTSSSRVRFSVVSTSFCER